MITAAKSLENVQDPDLAQLTNVGQIRAKLLSGAIPLEHVVGVVLSGLNAKICFNRKVGNEVEVVERPDYSTRLKYLQFLTETVEGMPVKRQEIISRKMPTMAELEENLKRSPALRRSLQRILDTTSEKAVEVSAV